MIEVSAAAGDRDERALARPALHLPGAVDVEKIVPDRESRAIRERLGIPADVVVVAMWSRLDPDRHHRVVLEAWALLKDEFPAAWLLFAGSGEFRTHLLAKARALGLAARLVVAGRNDLAFPESRACTDVLVQLAEGSDGSCRTVLEGMAAGLAVIGARVGVVGDYLRDGETGLLVERADAPLLAQALRRVLGDAGLRRRLGERARTDAVARFDIRRQAERLEGIYREALKKLQIPR